MRHNERVDCLSLLGIRIYTSHITLAHVIPVHRTHLIFILRVVSIAQELCPEVRMDDWIIDNTVRSTNKFTIDIINQSIFVYAYKQLSMLMLIDQTNTDLSDSIGLFCGMVIRV